MGAGDGGGGLDAKDVDVGVDGPEVGDDGVGDGENLRAATVERNLDPEGTLGDHEGGHLVEGGGGAAGAEDGGGVGGEVGFVGREPYEPGHGTEGDPVVVEGIAQRGGREVAELDVTRLRRRGGGRGGGGSRSVRRLH